MRFLIAETDPVSALNLELMVEAVFNIPTVTAYSRDEATALAQSHPVTHALLSAALWRGAWDDAEREIGSTVKIAFIGARPAGASPQSPWLARPITIGQIRTLKRTFSS